MSLIIIFINIFLWIKIHLLLSYVNDQPMFEKLWKLGENVFASFDQNSELLIICNFLLFFCFCGNYYSMLTYSGVTLQFQPWSAVKLVQLYLLLPFTKRWKKLTDFRTICGGNPFRTSKSKNYLLKFRVFSSVAKF